MRTKNYDKSSDTDSSADIDILAYLVANGPASIMTVIREVDGFDRNKYHKIKDRFFRLERAGLLKGTKTPVKGHQRILWSSTFDEVPQTYKGAIYLREDGKLNIWGCPYTDCQCLSDQKEKCKLVVEIEARNVIRELLHDFIHALDEQKISDFIHAKYANPQKVQLVTTEVLRQLKTKNATPIEVGATTS